MFQGFKNFLMQGQLVVVAVGLSIALAFSTLVSTFTGAVITPLVNAIRWIPRLPLTSQLIRSETARGPTPTFT